MPTKMYKTTRTNVLADGSVKTYTFFYPKTVKGNQINLTKDQIIDIKRRVSEGYRKKAICLMYEISPYKLKKILAE